MKKGFTLVEMLVAIVILSVGLLSVAQVFPVAQRSVFKTQQYTKAIEFAEEQMEELRTIDYDELDNTPYSSGIDTTDKFIKTWTVSVDGSPTSGSRYAHITVYWDPRVGSSDYDYTTDGAQVNVSISSYIADVQW